MRKALLGLLTAALVGLPAIPASAAMDDCPAGVSDVRGTQPTLAQVDAMLQASAAAHDVPLSILRVIAYKESTWRQFAAAGSNQPVLVSNDGVCSLGIMQVTVGDRTDGVELAKNAAYNVDEGAKILRAKWELSQQTPPPADSAPDDPDVIENWYYALCLYNGCDGSSDLYAADAAKLLHDPFRYLPSSFRVYIKPAGFTRPSDADPTYVFPSAFQARHDPDEFVFYDHTTGTVTKTVPARTHLVSAPPVVAYPQYAVGPDGPGAVCFQCGGWRLAEGVGLSGRARWTNSIVGEEPQSEVQYDGFPMVPGGRYRVDAYVPALGDETLGIAPYAIHDGATGTNVTVDQNARKGGWTTLTERTFTHFVSVTVSDLSSVAGQKIVADAIRIVPVARLTLDRSGPAAVTYGGRIGLKVDLSSPLGHLAGRSVKLFRRVRGTGTWIAVGAWKTDANGAFELNTAPDRNYEYTARFGPAAGDYHTPGASGVVRVDVRPKVGASFTNNGIVSREYTTLNTSVLPSHAGQTVYLQRFYSGAWRNVTSRTLNAYSKASFTFTMTNTAPTYALYHKHLFRVYKPADADHVLSVSPAVELLVYPRP